MKKVIAGIAAVAVVGTGAAAVGYNVYLKEPMQAVKLIRSFAETKEMALDAEVTASMQQETWILHGEVYRTQAEEHDVFEVMLPQTALYVSGNRLILPSGHVWNLGELPEMKFEVSDMTAAIGLMRYTEVSHDKETGIYTISLDEGKADKLCRELKITLPEAVGTLQSAEVSVSKDMLSVTGTSDIGSVHAETVNNGKETPEIPAAVLDAIVSGKDGKLLFSEENIRLVKGALKLASKDTITADVTMNGSLGFLSLSNKMQFSRKTQDGIAVSAVKDDLIGSVYMGNGRICTESGTLLSKDQSELTGSLELMNKMPLMFLAGDYDYREENGQYVYTIALDEGMMNDMLVSIVPAAQYLNLTLKDGTVSLWIHNDTINAGDLEINGSLSFFGREIESGVKGALIMTDHGFTVPDAVMLALK